MKVLIAHPGTQHSFHLARQLEKAGLLYRFYTSIAIVKNSLQAKIFNFLPAGISKKIGNRVVEDIPSEKIKTISFPEYQLLFRLKNATDPEQVIHERNIKFQQSIPDNAIMQADVVIGFDTSSWLLAERCRKFNKKFILDISIGHPLSKEKIYDALAAQYPEWKEQVIPKKREFIDVECREMDMADGISVPSEFVKQTLIENNVAPAKIKINPFGTFIDEFKFNGNKKIDNGKIIFLFMGAFSARKGLPFLLAAWKELNPANAALWIAGYGKMPAAISLPQGVINKGMIAKDERQALFDSAHVFLFPSFFEGLAQVQLQAMACGLPVVGTKNSGAYELVDNGSNGFIISTGNIEELKNAIEYFIADPGKINIMGIAARKKAEQFSWDDYGKRWSEFIIEVVSRK